MDSLIVLVLIGAVYLIINVGLPQVPINALVRAYVLQPLVWAAFILAMRSVPPNRTAGRPALRNTFIQLALGTAVVQVVLYAIGGLFSGFGKNPSSMTLLGITENMFFVGSALIGTEMARAWLVTRYARRHSFIILTAATVVFTFTSIPLGQVTGFRPEMQSTNLVISSWVPLLAENLLASLLAMCAGAPASLAYRALLAAFWWFCPILPDLTWSLKGLIGAAIPVLGMVAVSSYNSTQTSRGKSKRRARAAAFPAGWVVTALGCVAILWFAVGVFPLQPSLVGSGSMTPVLQTGDIVIVAKVPASTIRLGDIIEYRKDKATNIVHRVIDIDDSGGARTLTTKGDANQSADPAPVPAENVVGRVVFDIRRVGLISIIVKRLLAGGG